jgi:bifunctional enzyme CysN/CysC
MLNDQGIIVICSFISPHKNNRAQVAEIIGTERFKLIFMDADLEFCKQNKPELYQLAEEGKLDNLPGVDVLFDKPEKAELTLKPNNLKQNLEAIIDLLYKEKIYPI